MRRDPEVFENWVTGKKKKKKKEEGEEEERGWKSWKGVPELAKHRCTVERSIGAMKRWGVLSNVSLISRLGEPKISNLLLLIAALTNCQLESNKKERW